MIELFSQSDREETLIHLLETEPLFVALQDCMDQYDKLLAKHTTKVENWVDAKEFMANLFKSPVPTAMVSIEYQKLSNKSTAITPHRRGKGGDSDFITNLHRSQQEIEIGAVLSYSLIIAYYLICTREEQKYKDVFKKLKSLCSEHGLPRREILAEMELSITNGFENGSITDVYDYTKLDGGLVDIPADETEEERDDEEVAEGRFPHRITVGYLLSLMGIKSKENIKNQAALKRALQGLTGVPPTSVNNYLGDFSLALRNNQTELDRLNKELRDAGLPEFHIELDSE